MERIPLHNRKIVHRALANSLRETLAVSKASRAAEIRYMALLTFMTPFVLFDAISEPIALSKGEFFGKDGVITHMRRSIKNIKDTRRDRRTLRKVVRRATEVTMVPRLRSSITSEFRNTGRFTVRTDTSDYCRHELDGKEVTLEQVGPAEKEIFSSMDRLAVRLRGEPATNIRQIILPERVEAGNTADFL